MTVSESDLDITPSVEEEFFLVNPDTRDLESDPDPGIFEACERNRGPHTVAHEVLRTQIETSTKVCVSVSGAREAVRETRRLVRPPTECSNSSATSGAASGTRRTGSAVSNGMPSRTSVPGPSPKVTRPTWWRS